MLADPHAEHQITITASNRTGGRLAVSCNCLRGRIIHMARELPGWLAREHYRHWHLMRGIWVP